jgi:hypothetical protein
VPAAALRTAALMAADAAVTLRPEAAAAMTAAVAPDGSAAYAPGDTVAVVLICIENSDRTRTVSVTDPSGATRTADTIVIFVGATPPASLRRLSVAAARMLDRTALTTAMSELPGGREKTNVCVRGAEII